MALVRILVDGYSLLHSWPELAEGRPRHSEAARDELISILTQYRDATHIPITIVFDGSGPRAKFSKAPSTPDVEVLFSTSGQTADQIIERVAHRMQPYGEVMAVTNDHAERDTVVALGGTSMSCENFLRMIAGALGDLASDLDNYNSREKRRYKRS